jgi:hypothetical protein
MRTIRAEGTAAIAVMGAAMSKGRNVVEAAGLSAGEGAAVATTGLRVAGAVSERTARGAPVTEGGAKAEEKVAAGMAEASGHMATAEIEIRRHAKLRSGIHTTTAAISTRTREISLTSSKSRCFPRRHWNSMTLASRSNRADSS